MNQDFNGLWKLLQPKRIIRLISVSHMPEALATHPYIYKLMQSRMGFFIFISALQNQIMTDVYVLINNSLSGEASLLRKTYFAQGTIIIILHPHIWIEDTSSSYFYGS